MNSSLTKLQTKVYSMRNRLRKLSCHLYLRFHAFRVVRALGVVVAIFLQALQEELTNVPSR